MFSRKMTKLRMLIIWVPNIKIWNRKYHYEACNNDFHVIPLHVKYRQLKMAKSTVNSLTKRSNLPSSLSQGFSDLVRAVFDSKQPMPYYLWVKTATIDIWNHHVRWWQRWQNCPSFLIVSKERMAINWLSLFYESRALGGLSLGYNVGEEPELPCMVTKLPNLLIFKLVVA